RGRARRSRPGGGPPEAAGGDGGSSPARGGSGGPTGRPERVPFPGSGSWVEASPFYFLRVPAAGGPTRRPPDAIIPSMPLQNILAAAAISLLGLAPAPPQPGNVYRLHLAPGHLLPQGEGGAPDRVGAGPPPPPRHRPPLPPPPARLARQRKESRRPPSPGPRPARRCRPRTEARQGPDRARADRSRVGRAGRKREGGCAHGGGRGATARRAQGWVRALQPRPEIQAGVGLET